MTGAAIFSTIVNLGLGFLLGYFIGRVWQRVVR